MEPSCKPAQPLSILLVEDEPFTLKLLRDTLALKYAGITFHTAVNGRMGWEVFQACLAHVVITDINMPEMSGVRMAEKIRAVRPETHFIIITGDAGRLDFESSVGEGWDAANYISKPVRFGPLFAAIDRCLSQV